MSGSYPYAGKHPTQNERCGVYGISEREKTRMTRLRVASDECMAGRPILRRTCAQPVSFRAMPENEIPRALHVDIYLFTRFLCVIS